MRSSLTEDTDEFGEVGADTSYFQSLMPSYYDSAESIADYEKCWLHDCICKIEDHESSRMPIAPGKLAALFSFGSEKLGNQFKSSVFRNADPSNLGRSLLEGSKDHLLSQAKSELMRQEHQVGSLNNFNAKF